MRFLCTSLQSRFNHPKNFSGLKLMHENHTEELQSRIEKLKTEHRDLDDVLKRLAVDPSSDELQIRRLKKRKLQLKDSIVMLENQALPDLTA